MPVNMGPLTISGEVTTKVDVFWGVQHEGLFTPANSKSHAKAIALWRKKAWPGTVVSQTVLTTTVTSPWATE